MNKKQTKIVIIFTFVAAIVALTTTILAIAVGFAKTGQVNYLQMAIGGLVVASIFFLARTIKKYNQ